MAFDIALDRETGDWLFGPTHDLMGTTGPELDAQRIIVRAKIPRGTFLGDTDGTLGSNLHMVSRSPTTRGLAEAEAYLHEALQDMEGVSIGEITVSVVEGNQIRADISFTQTGAVEGEGEELEIEESVELPEFNANVLISELE